jgi:hypothetical protein
MPSVKTTVHFVAKSAHLWKIQGLNQIFTASLFFCHKQPRFVTLPITFAEIISLACCVSPLPRYKYKFSTTVVSYCNANFAAEIFVSVSIGRIASFSIVIEKLKRESFVL